MKMKHKGSPGGRAAPEYRLPDLSPQRQERIMELTMKKINEPNAPKTRTRWMRIALIAAASAVFLCGSAFAAYTNGWFGFTGVFGEKTAIVEQDVVSYGENADVQMTQPSYTEEEQNMIEDGTMTVPDQATLSEDCIGASTEDYQFTLEEMIATPDTLYAILRVDARNEAAKASLMDADAEPEDGLCVLAKNNSGSGRERELKNGGMSCTFLTAEDAGVYFLLSNSGGQFEEGDVILFHSLIDNIDLFSVPVTHLMDAEVTVALDPSVYEGKSYQFASVTITPISLVANGSYTVSPDQSCPVIVITLKDGTSFELANIQNGFAYTPYGTYGSLSSAGTCGDPESAEGPFIRHSWAFSQVVDPGEIESITVDGVVYPLG